MSEESVLQSYLAGLEQWLPSPATEIRMRAGEADRPLTPFAPHEIGPLQHLLLQSQALQAELWQRWQAAEDARQRSMVEVQLLAAAAADLAMAERLTASNQPAVRMRSAISVNQEGLILQALRDPASLLAPAALPAARRGGEGTANEKTVLLEATWNCLEAVRKDTARASRDAITSLLSMRLAVLKEAAEMLGGSIIGSLQGEEGGFLQTAVDYVLSAILKLRLLIGPEGEQQVKEAVLEFLEKVKEEEFLAKNVDKFLGATQVYEDGKAWLRGYEGDAAALAPLTAQMAALQGSFAGRVKVADMIVKGLAVVKLLPALAAPPWGPLAVAAAYLGVVGYVLYSAHDHIDSDKYAFFDRVDGVRGVLRAALVTAENS